MDKKERRKKTFLLVEVILLTVFLLAVIGCFIVQLAFPDLDFANWIRENVWDVKKSYNGLKAHVPTLIRSLIYIFIVYAVCRLLRVFFSAKMKKSYRAKTVFSLLDGFVKYACAIAIIILILKACGVNTAALVASIGVLTLIVGLGAQPLISDIIAGIFIIFENEYQVGEIVTINDFRGSVVEIGIRSTKLLDAAGNIKIINNSAIGDVINLSRELSLAIVDCDFPYDVPVEIVENILKNNFEDIAKNIPAIKEGPYYKGVCMFKDSNVTIKIVAKCLEEDRFQVERDLNREYRRLLVENGIDIAYPQVVINYPTEKTFKVSKKDKVSAEEFTQEQTQLSKNMEEQQT
ncbi:MAG: mechanosensitive ion channel family protein [Clostridiales bacterium]|nr:mechanosensitive ion channel family protein [Clostridiales bacterium]